MLDRSKFVLFVIAVALVFTCLSSSTRLADTLLAFLMYVPSVLRLPILLSTAVIEFVFFVILLFKLEASTLIVGPSVPSFFVSFVLPLPSSPILIVDQVSLKI